MAVKIHGLEGSTDQEIHFEVQRGAKFVRYLYCISLIVVTFKRSQIYFIKPGESAVVKGLPWALISLLLGWWGIPWGPIYTVQSLFVDLKGGDDITAQIVPEAQPASAAAAMR